MPVRFLDRYDAGRVLGKSLKRFASEEGLLVLGIPRGGVPVAFEVAHALGAPLDVFVVRKLGVPGHEELAMGAIATGGVRIINWETVHAMAVGEGALEAVIREEQHELERRERLYREDREELVIAGRTVILVDDGLATGSSMRAAVLAVRQLLPRHLVVGVPIAAASACNELWREADDIIGAVTAEPFFAVSRWYENFAPTMDQEVVELLRAASIGLIGSWTTH